MNQYLKVPLDKWDDEMQRWFIGQYWFQKEYETDAVTNIHLNTKEFSIPRNQLVRIRRFNKKVVPIAGWSDDDEFNLDIKRTESWKDKTGPIFYGPLKYKEALVMAAKILGLEEVRPVLVVCYRREHYLPISGEKIKLTIDYAPIYWYCRSRTDIMPLGKEKMVRLEFRGDSENETWRLTHDHFLKSKVVEPARPKNEEGYRRIEGLLRIRHSVPS